jgi:hypothetical protein
VLLIHTVGVYCCSRKGSGTVRQHSLEQTSRCVHHRLCRMRRRLSSLGRRSSCCWSCVDEQIFDCSPSRAHHNSAHLKMNRYFGNLLSHRHSRRPRSSPRAMMGTHQRFGFSILSLQASSTHLIGYRALSRSPSHDRLHKFHRAAAPSTHHHLYVG